MIALSELLADNYNLDVDDVKLFTSHFGTEIYLAQTNKGKYIVKTLPLEYDHDMEKEGHITEYLHNNGVPVARLLKTKNGEYVVKTDERQFHVQDFIEGEVLAVNTAPEWFMEQSASILGKIHAVLKNYGELGVNFGGDFFRKETALGRKQRYIKGLNKAVETGNSTLVMDLEERIKHLDRISAFDIGSTKLTYVNSHGDFYIGQIIVKDENITVIDWTTACKLPASLEVIMSYVFAGPDCKYGIISGDGLKRYINRYSKHFQLTDYDIQIMPYLLYFQQIMCHYSPPYENIPATYKPVCNLINSFAKWLYENVEILEKELQI